MKRPSLPVAALAAALVACAARAPAVRIPTPGASAASTTAPLRPAVIHVLTRDWSSVTDGGPPEFRGLPGAAGCGGTRGIAGGRRAEVRGSSVALSEPGPVVDFSATELADGWVFSGHAGAHHVLFASERFTGALRLLGRVPAGVGSLSEDSRGRAVLLAHRSGALWTSDGHGITRVDSLPGPVASAAFDDANRAAAVLRDGALHETRDGGATWRRVALGGDLALRATHDGSALRVATNRGWFALDPGGLRPLPPTAGSPCAANARSMARMNAAHSAQIAPIAGDIAWLRGGGRVVVRDQFAITIITPEGRVHRGNGPTECDLVAPWGDGAFVHCGRAFRATADGHLWFVDGPTGGDDAFTVEGAAFSEDGTRAAIEGRCAGERGESGDPDDSGEGGLRAVCVYDERERSWRTVAVDAVPDIPARSWSDRDARRLLAMRGQTLFVRSGPAPGVYALDTVSGAVAPAAVPAGAEAEWRYHDLGLTAEGGIAGLAERCPPNASCETVLVAGRDERSLTARRAPDGAVRVGFADASRGVVASESLDRAWRTVDGGATWEPVPMPHTDRRSRERRSVSCGRDGCSLGARVRIEGWGPLPPPTPDAEAPELADTNPDDPPPAPPAPPVSLMGGASYACTLSAWRPSPWRLPPSLPPPEVQETTVWGRWARTRTSPPGAPEARYRSDWWSPAGHIAEPATPPGGVAGWVGRRPLVVLTPPAFAWGREGGTEGRVTSPELPEGTPVTVTEGREWLTAPGRDGSVVIAGGLRSPGLALDVVASLDAQGTLRASRLFPRAGQPDEGWRALVVTHGRGGVGRPVPGEALRVLPADGAPGESLTLPVWRGPVTPCAGSREDAATVVVAACRFDRAACALASLTSPRRGGRIDDERARFELSPRGVCLRSVSGVWAGRAPAARVEGSGRYFLTLDARGGALEGFVDDGARRARLRCAPSARAPTGDSDSAT